MADVKKIIKDLGDTNWSSDNENQMKAIQLLKGLATSDEKLSNDFMKIIDKATTDAANKLLATNEAENTATFKCPNCGCKVLEKTGYCVSCKKKVTNEKKKVTKEEKDDKKKDIDEGAFGEIQIDAQEMIEAGKKDKEIMKKLGIDEKMLKQIKMNMKEEEDDEKKEKEDKKGVNESAMEEVERLL